MVVLEFWAGNSKKNRPDAFSSLTNDPFVLCVGCTSTEAMKVKALRRAAGFITERDSGGIGRGAGSQTCEPKVSRLFAREILWLLSRDSRDVTSAAARSSRPITLAYSGAAAAYVY